MMHLLNIKEAYPDDYRVTYSLYRFIALSLYRFIILKILPVAKD